MIPEESEDIDFNLDWKPFKIDRVPGGFVAHMLGNTSGKMKLMSDVLIWSLEVFVDAWIHHLNIEHDLESKAHAMPLDRRDEEE